MFFWFCSFFSSTRPHTNQPSCYIDFFWINFIDDSSISPRVLPERSERPKLNLERRTKPLDSANELPARPKSIFGDAKPIDTSEMERRVKIILQF